VDSHGQAYTPRLGLAKVVAGASAHRHVIVRMPFFDHRAHQFLATEAAQLPKDSLGFRSGLHCVPGSAGSAMACCGDGRPGSRGLPSAAQADSAVPAAFVVRAGSTSGNTRYLCVELLGTSTRPTQDVARPSQKFSPSLRISSRCSLVPEARATRVGLRRRTEPPRSLVGSLALETTSRPRPFGLQCSYAS
jgi:hypothetical protein